MYRNQTNINAAFQTYSPKQGERDDTIPPEYRHLLNKEAPVSDQLEALAKDIKDPHELLDLLTQLEFVFAGPGKAGPNRSTPPPRHRYGDFMSSYKRTTQAPWRWNRPGSNSEQPNDQVTSVRFELYYSVRLSNAMMKQAPMPLGHNTRAAPYVTDKLGVRHY
ncbi:unnamed protein product [Cylicocyclus nassatus]|uniref:Uncharacterized protein n=1 Tax=Cylicocyclus nassatus TaxID=53992 RepID=A0AA36H419_CYLNA|nr:unnamed protein product [Cylicocyclus nassatus]